MKKSKWLSVLIIVMFMMTVLPVSAFGNIEVLSIPVVNDDSVVSLGVVFMESTAGKIHDGDSAVVTLPEGFKFLNEAGEVMKDEDWKSIPSANTIKKGDANNYFEFPKQYLGNDNALTKAFFAGNYNDAVHLNVYMLDENEIKIVVQGEPAAGLNGYTYIHFGKIYVESGFTGTITATISSPSGSGIDSGSIPVGRVTGGAVDLSVSNVPNFSDNTNEDGNVKIRIKEDAPGALEDKSESVKLVLPRGFEWDKGNLEVKLLWGEAKGKAKADLEKFLKDSIRIDDDTFYLDIPKGFESTKAMYFEVTIDVVVEDETDAKVGDVIAKVYGKSDIGQKELKVGKYGQYDVTIEVADVPEIFSGQLEQEIGKIIIEESVNQSLMDGRTITMTLPSNAKWGKLDTDKDKSVGVEVSGFPGKDGQVAKWTINGKSTSAAKLELDDMEVIVEPGFEGDLVVEVAGTQGLKDEITVAKVVKPVTIAAASTPPNLVIGAAGQAIGNLTITENIDGALKKNKDLIVRLPEGVKYTKAPKIEVTDGDLKIDEAGVTTGNNDRDLIIPIDGESNEASTIVAKDVKLTLDRTVPEGDIDFKVRGEAVNECNDWAEVEKYFKHDGKNGYVVIDTFEAFELKDGAVWPNTNTAAKVVGAVTGTPAPVDQKITAQFILGSTTYSVNGVEQTMDIAPYAKNGRTYLPLRYVGIALGVNNENILWDGTAATLLKGEKIVQVTPGSKIMLINGVSITMDVAPEAVDGRTMLPFRWIAQALGASVDYDADNKAINMSL